MGLACPPDQREENKKARGPNLLRKNAKSGQVLVRTQDGEKGRPAVAPDEAPPHHAGLFLDLVKRRSCEPSTENAKSGQVLVRTRGCEKGRPVASPHEAPPHHAGLRVDLVKHRSREPPTENAKKRTGFGSHPGGVKTNPSTISHGVCQEF
jgi:hypothetical protein